MVNIPVLIIDRLSSSKIRKKITHQNEINLDVLYKNKKWITARAHNNNNNNIYIYPF